MKQVLTNATIYTGKEILTGSAILINDGVIVGFVYDTDIPDDYEVRDLGGNNIAPALIDLADIWRKWIFIFCRPFY